MLFSCYDPRMSHRHRFYIDPGTATTTEIALEGAELHHALNVVRLREGEPVALFDGRGRELLGHVAQRDKRSISIAVEEEREHPAPKPHITLAQAWLHNPNAIAWLLKHGTEIGIAHFVFFRAQHSVKAPQLNEKMERVTLEACKQCGRNWLPELAVVKGLEDALAGDYDQRWIGALDEKPKPLHGAEKAGRILLIIGPEGDFTAEEMKMATYAGAWPFSLGGTVFRGEVAAVHAAALLQYEHGQMGPME